MNTHGVPSMRGRLSSIRAAAFDSGTSASCLDLCRLAGIVQMPFDSSAHDILAASLRRLPVSKRNLMYEPHGTL